jgi:2-oxoglutarate ferredoxin oxidoreductase subunit delta
MTWIIQVADTLAFHGLDEDWMGALPGGTEEQAFSRPNQFHSPALLALGAGQGQTWSWSFVEQHDTIINGTYPQKVTEELEESLQNPNPEHPVFLVRAWCKGCGLCVEICPRQVLSTDGRGKVEVVAPERCTSCGMCEMVCPDFALVVGTIERE